MISLIAIGMALIWLGHETNWMRIHLPVGITYTIGACSQWRMSDSAVDGVMKRDLLHDWFGGGACDKILRCHFDLPNQQPLFGWGYAYQYRNLKPLYKIELIDEHSHYTMRSESIPTLRDAFRVYRNPYLKVRL